MSTAEVEVELHELLDWHRVHEHFIEVLVDHISEDILGWDPDVDDSDPPEVLISEYAITSVSHPNCVIFSVKYRVEDLPEFDGDDA
jgi:hypothetical protein